ncbi:biotin/lipoyl-containing protein [Actinokineospora sp. NBRC 105648]|uniref:acetyl-CoA carboxylase biotin carboxyl carrier protein n=1 Tax=Actinokineospora sp. NBRC 105648 TaxID=3032206 RepID=UPI0024A47255|nr:biotin/lipoyl-containing protein [Actinokineospora sp. NBRC 105648]GLZ36544.1 hypothetical protein Acsp05_01690 [Actinokineospora sp. NBRC 105648]
MTTTTDTTGTAGTSSPVDVLEALRDNVIALCAQAPRPPSWVKVTAGEVGVEISFADVAVAIAGAPVQAPVAAPVPALAPRPVERDPEPAAAVEDLRHVGSPTVGVFYRSPEPGADPFVAEGATVAPGQQVGIVEAMKLMIPVEADRAGRVVALLVADGTPVEYGEPLISYVPETA